MSQEKESFITVTPPVGMSQVYLYRGRPFVYGLGPRGFIHWWSDINTWIDEQIAQDATPIRPFDADDLQPLWVIAPERVSQMKWQIWVVEKGRAYPSDWEANSRFAAWLGQRAIAVYKRHEIHGVNCLKRIYLHGKKEGDEIKSVEFRKARDGETPGEELTLTTECKDIIVGSSNKPGRWREDESGAVIDLGAGTYTIGDVAHTEKLLTEADLEAMPNWTRIPDDDEPPGAPKRLGRWRHDHGYVVDLDAGQYTSERGITERLRGDWSFIMNTPRWTRIPDNPPTVADVDWSVGLHLPAEPPEGVQPPEVDSQGRTPDQMNGTVHGFMVDSDGGVIWEIKGDPPPIGSCWIARYDRDGGLLGYRGTNGGWVQHETQTEPKGRKLRGHCRPNHPPVCQFDTKNIEIECSNGCGLVPHRWRPSPEAGPHWRCSECGEPWTHPGPMCSECGGKGSTGMGPCSLCVTKETSTPPVPEPILRICPVTGNLSLRLEALSPKRDVALEQCALGFRTADSGLPERLFGELCRLWNAIYRNYPRARHLREIEAAYVAYVKTQDDVPKEETKESQEDNGGQNH